MNDYLHPGDFQATEQQEDSVPDYPVPFFRRNHKIYISGIFRIP